MTIPSLTRQFRSKNIQDQPEKLKGANTRKIIAIAGGKGGVGKTIITSIVGVALAEKGAKTVVVDLDFGGANLHQALGILSPPRSLADFTTRTNLRLPEMCLETFVPNLSLIAGSTGSLYASHMQHWIKQKVIRHIAKIDAEYILLDIGAGSSFNQLDYFNIADEKIVVVTPEPLAIQDAYNFIKLALFRNIYREMKNVPELRQAFGAFLSKGPTMSPPTMATIAKIVKDKGDIYLEHLRKVVRGMRPYVIFNMLETADDYKESYALQIALKDILGISPKNTGFVRYDDAIRRTAKQMRPDLLFGDDIDATNDIRQIVKNFFFQGKTRATSIPKNNEKFYALQTPAKERNKVICSVHCKLWGNCSTQNGGFDCRIPVIGFVNQK